MSNTSFTCKLISLIAGATMLGIFFNSPLLGVGIYLIVAPMVF